MNNSLRLILIIYSLIISTVWSSGSVEQKQLVDRSFTKEIKDDCWNKVNTRLKGYGFKEFCSFQWLKVEIPDGGGMTL